MIVLVVVIVAVLLLAGAALYDRRSMTGGLDGGRAAAQRQGHVGAVPRAAPRLPRAERGPAR